MHTCRTSILTVWFHVGAQSLRIIAATRAEIYADTSAEMCVDRRIDMYVYEMYTIAIGDMTHLLETSLIYKRHDSCK